MANIKKRRISWGASASGDVEKYFVYWSPEASGSPDYNSPHAEVNAPTTELTVPDDAPSFPLDEGNYIIGVSAVDDVGNESDMSFVTAPFDFVVPDAPGSISVESV